MIFLINRTDAIGDIILTMPMAASIKKTYPKAKVYFLISKKCEDLFLNHPYIDGTFTYPHKSSKVKRWAFVKQVFNEIKPTHYLYVGGVHLPSIYALMKKINFRGGLKSKWPTFFLLNEGVRQKRALVTQHEVHYNLELLKPLALEFEDFDTHQFLPEIHIDDSVAHANFHEFVKELDPERRELIFIHPGMTGHTLNWSSKNYGRLIDQIEARYPDRFSFVISHTPSDGPYLLGIKDHFNANPKNQKNLLYFNGLEKGLAHYMSILSKAALFVGPSTGTTHIANTLGVKTVGLYSPIKVQSSFRWGPFKPGKTRVIVPDVVCGMQVKCEGRECPYYECMAKIEVEQVCTQVVELLESK